MNKILLFTLFLFSSYVFAEAPFCVQDAVGVHCWYYSVGDCNQAAGQSGGMCIPNPQN